MVLLAAALHLDFASLELRALHAGESRRRDAGSRDDELSYRTDDSFISPTYMSRRVELRAMRRRAILAAVGCLAGGAIASSAATAAADSTRTEDERDCETTEVATTMSGDETDRTREVPEPWWEQVERSRAVAAELRAEFGDEEWFDSVGRTLGDTEICGRTAFVVTVDARDEAVARATLEESRDGVPIRIEEATESAPLGGDGDDADADEIDDGNESDADASSGEETEAEDDEPDGGANETGDAKTGADGSDDSVPGFGIVGGLVGVGAAGYLAGRGRDD